MKSLGVDLKKIDECMGDPEADAENAVLKAEQQAQIEKGIRGDVMILPTLVINNREYRGKLDKKAVLKAICSGFKETTEPPICLSHGKDVATSVGWGFAWTVVLGVAAIGVVGYTFYKYRVRRYMDSEIRAIMSQYMPLGNEGEEIENRASVEAVVVGGRDLIIAIVKIGTQFDCVLHRFSRPYSLSHHRFLPGLPAWQTFPHAHTSPEDFVDDPGAVLENMKANHIGNKRSLFYQAYALYYEKLKKFPDAEKMYHLGVQK
ncbi:unnamed protein product [Lactuca virosa]|uniref:BUB1 N-terminal domain-containing protein n=1 Tax=Lactuca virosa TaxID=75947 RepID=A0AAU9LY94_9ASTR|nr:unnamed protein product [Lactuca virosa]